MAIVIPRAGSAKPRNKISPDINITPLVDVVLVLLIIFMVVAPQMEAGESVDIPSILNPDKESKSKLEPLLVTVTKSGRMLVEKTEMKNKDALKARLEQEHQTNPRRRIILKGDIHQTYGFMRSVFSLCQDVGFRGVSLVVGQKKTEGKM